MFAITTETSHPVDHLVDEVLAEYHPSSYRYARALCDGSMTREHFIATQRQFCHAVDYFSRPMAVLASRLPRAEQRVDILHNVWEEHGEGNLRFHHGTTFRAFLTAVAGDATIPPVSPAVGQFNAALAGVCGSEHPMVGVAALGMMERLFADMSAMIGEAVVARGWVARDALVHYATHETLDIEHADEFFDVARRDWGHDPLADREFARGLTLGAYMFAELYDGLWRS